MRQGTPERIVAPPTEGGYPPKFILKPPLDPGSPVAAHKKEQTKNVCSLSILVERERQRLPESSSAMRAGDFFK
jgi:hypothetical protein